MAVLRGNIYEHIVVPEAGEWFQTLLTAGALRIERIVSSDQPEPKLYDQAHDEWVMLLEGRAELQIGQHRVHLAPGDWVMIPARTRHRVVATRPEPRCLWLALHLPGTPPVRPCSPETAATDGA